MSDEFLKEAKEYFSNQDIPHECPKCGAENEREINLGGVNVADARDRYVQNAKRRPVRVIATLDCKCQHTLAVYDPDA